MAKNGKPEPPKNPPVVETSKTEPREDAGFKVKDREGNEPPKTEVKSLTIRYLPDGSIDPSMGEKTWRKIADVLDKNPAIKAGLLGGSGAKGEGLIQPKQIEPFYSGIGMVNVFLAIKLMKLNADVAASIIPYSKDELELLSGATADAVNENLDKCPAWLLDLLHGGGSVAFAKLAMVLFQVHAQKLAAVRQAMAGQGDGGQKQPSVN